MMAKRVVIIGTGLMGGSLGIALRANNPALTVIGVDSDETIEVAVSRGAISEGMAHVEDATPTADIIFIATPPAAALNIVRRIAPHLKKGAVVSDMCSVKIPIDDVAHQVLGPDVLFIGGHPMTGSERGGIRHAKAVLFENATYVLCPQGPILPHQESGYALLTQLLGLVGARIIEMSAEKHDRIAARVSHLPQLLSVLLMNAASSSRERDPELLLLAAGGFRDMTRIASSPFPMWRDILDENQHEVQVALADMEVRLKELKHELQAGNLEYVRQLFHDAEQTRDFIPVDRKGFLAPLSDVFVFTSDKPGALVDITTVLFNAKLSIKDIELLRIREGTGGTFRLGFHASFEADKAVEVLNGSGISAYRL